VREEATGERDGIGPGSNACRVVDGFERLSDLNEVAVRVVHVVHRPLERLKRALAQFDGLCGEARIDERAQSLRDGLDHRGPPGRRVAVTAMSDAPVEDGLVDRLLEGCEVEVGAAVASRFN